jgi:hypothetical protein
VPQAVLPEVVVEPPPPDERKKRKYASTPAAMSTTTTTTMIVTMRAVRRRLGGGGTTTGAVATTTWDLEVVVVGPSERSVGGLPLIALVGNCSGEIVAGEGTRANNEGPRSYQQPRRQEPASVLGLCNVDACEQGEPQEHREAPEAVSRPDDIPETPNAPEQVRGDERLQLWGRFVAVARLTQIERLP